VSRGASLLLHVLWRALLSAEIILRGRLPAGRLLAVLSMSGHTRRARTRLGIRLNTLLESSLHGQSANLRVRAVLRRMPQRPRITPLRKRLRLPRWRKLTAEVIRLEVIRDQSRITDKERSGEKCTQLRFLNLFGNLGAALPSGLCGGEELKVQPGGGIS
jgi:hypothetical protein